MATVTPTPQAEPASVVEPGSDVKPGEPASAAPPHLPSEPPTPTSRLLRGYAFDPSLATQLETALVSEITYKVPWETLEPRTDRRVRRGGRLRPAERCFYAPVDLTIRPSWRRTACAPSEGNPQFHQQMVYAVAMTTIDRFERALGRKAFWTDRFRHGDGSVSVDGPVRAAAADLPARAAHGQCVLQPRQGRAAVRLLPGHRGSDLRPVSRRHGLHLPVARHHRARDDARAARRLPRALHGGDQPRRAGLPRGVRRHRRAVPALHVSRGADAPDRARRAAISGSENLLAQLATQFGHARGTHGALRDAIGRYDPDTGEVGEARARSRRARRRPWRCTRAARSWWRRSSTRSCRSIKTARATCCGWRAAAPACCAQGELHPDLVNRLAQEAAKAAEPRAQHVHPRARLLPARRPDLRRVSAGADHRGHGPDARGRARLPRRVHRGLPPARHLSARRAHAVGRQPALGQARRGSRAWRRARWSAMLEHFIENIRAARARGQAALRSATGRPSGTRRARSAIELHEAIRERRGEGRASAAAHRPGA